MYYVKAKLAEGVIIEAEITEDNVFTRCAGCGTEMRENLSVLAEEEAELFANGGQLLSCTTYCAACAAKRAN